MAAYNDRNSDEFNSYVDKLQQSIKGLTDQINAVNFRQLRSNFDLLNGQIIRAIVGFEAVINKISAFATDFGRKMDKASKDADTNFKKTGKSFKSVADDTSVAFKKLTQKFNVDTDAFMRQMRGNRPGADEAGFGGTTKGEKPSKEKQKANEKEARANAKFDKERQKRDEKANKFYEKAAKEKQKAAIEELANVKRIEKEKEDALKKTRGKGFFENLAASFKPVTAGFIGGGIEGTQGKTTGLGDALSRSFNQYAKDIGFAIDNMIGGFMKAAYSIAGIAAVAALFVRAFNPAIVENFVNTMKDLSAVIGAGLQPILAAITVVFRAVADSLVPIVDKMAPGLNALGDLITRLLVPIFQSLSVVANKLIPYFNQLSSVLATVAGKFSDTIATLIEGLTPTLLTLAQLFNVLLQILSPLLSIFNTLLSVTMPFLSVALAGFAVQLAVDALVALGAFIASIYTASNALTLGLAGLVTIIVGGLSYVLSNFSQAMQDLSDMIGHVIDVISHPLDRLMGRETEFQRGLKDRDEGFGLTGASTGIAARRAEYTSVEDLSKNLIKASFSGGATDRLKNIDNNGKRQVELLEQIAGNKKAPVALAGDNRLPGAKV
jgi:hypothetical protein